MMQLRFVSPLSIVVKPEKRRLLDDILYILILANVSSADFIASVTIAPDSNRPNKANVKESKSQAPMLVSLMNPPNCVNIRPGIPTGISRVFIEHTKGNIIYFLKQNF